MSMIFINKIILHIFLQILVLPHVFELPQFTQQTPVQYKFSFLAAEYN